MRTCNKCGIEKELSEFYPYKNTCKKCKNLERAALRMSTIDRYVQSTISRIKFRCKQRNIPFNLSYDHLFDRWVVQDSKCFYTDKPLEIKRFRETRDDSPSVDRVIPELGYVDGNVVWCLNRVNLIKNDVTLEEMKDWMPDWYRRIKNEF